MDISLFNIASQLHTSHIMINRRVHKNKQGGYKYF